jgi:RHS repeat-associated protein
VVYGYDPLNRLTSGTSTAGFSETGIQYDNVGNIKQLIRGTNTGIYAYNGNQLTSVTGITTSNYSYDPNGNVSHEGRNNATIGYNMLNLPQTVTATTPVAINISYTYDAGGTKLRKVSNGVSTDYIGGIQYKPDAATIDFIQTELGRAVPITGGYEYQYILTDHLGNNRVTFGTKTGAAVKLQVDDYYPFGLDANSLVTSPQNKYLYNKKELQEELGQYDYGSRFYDPVVGRFNMIDRFAEKYAVISPYQYGANDPIRNLDVAGDSIIVTVNARDDKKLWDSFHTLAKTPLGKIFLDKYINSNIFDIYVTKSEGNNTDVFNTFANIERRHDVIDGAIELKSPENIKTFKGLEGHKVKPKHVSAVTAINATVEKTITKYDIAAAIFHEIIAHIEGELPDFNADDEHANYGTRRVPIYGIYTDGSDLSNVLEGSLAWQISEQLIQLKIQEGNGTTQDKSDLKKMLEADKKRKADREEQAHQNH